MKTVLITGANSGIGFATVQLFLDNNYKVFAHYNQNRNSLESLDNKNLFLVKANLLYMNETEELFKEVMKETERIDVLVNNAGLYMSADTDKDLSIEAFDEVLNVNLKAPFILSKMFIHIMKNFSSGKIINISSIGVKYGGSYSSMFYTISKAALESLTLSLAKEGSKYNILVNAIRVGVTDTDIHKINKNKNMNDRVELIPLRRMAETKEIAEQILFLSSSKNSFMTGSIVTVAGGE
ncbi:MAG: SDR family oxidoreductase [Sulfurimonas sp.]|nr:SDR family oxidoreductase [Sulfurimonas sp.]